MASKIIQYLISTVIQPDALLVKIGLGVGVALMILGPIFWLVGRRFQSSLWGNLLVRIAPILAVAGLGWFILFGLRWQSLVPFNRRVWVYVWGAMMIGWFGYSLWTFRHVLPKKKQENERFKKYEQYLPKPKRT